MKRSQLKATANYAFKHSLPILVGFFPVGLAYGVLMQSAGYNFLWTGACCLFVFAGSLQFLMVTFLAGGVSIATVAIMALLLNSRHIFYGLPFIEKFHSFGGWKYFLIYSLTDENFSLHCSHDIPEDADEKGAYVLTALFTLIYWIVPSVLGALLGMVIPFDTTGIDFALTALFITILLDILKDAKNIFPAVAAFISSIVCLIIIGADNFILPSLLITVCVLVLLRPRLGKEFES